MGPFHRNLLPTVKSSCNRQILLLLCSLESRSSRGSEKNNSLDSITPVMQATLIRSHCVIQRQLLTQLSAITTKNKTYISFWLHPVWLNLNLVLTLGKVRFFLGGGGLGPQRGGLSVKVSTKRGGPYLM